MTQLKPFWQMSEYFHLDAENFAETGVPWKNRYKYIEDVQPNNEEQVNLMNTFNSILRSYKGAFVFVSGGKDTGKTFLGSALVNSAARWSSCIDRGTTRMFSWNPKFVSMDILIERLTNFRSHIDWFREYSVYCKLLVIDRWTLLDGNDPLPNAVRKRLESLLKASLENGNTVILLSRLLWANAYDQFTTAFRQELPEMYIRPLAYPYKSVAARAFDDDDRDVDF